MQTREKLELEPENQKGKPKGGTRASPRSKRACSYVTYWRIVGEEIVLQRLSRSRDNREYICILYERRLAL